MNRLADRVCQALLDNCPSNKRERYLSFLPKEEQKKLLSSEEVSLDIPHFTHQIDTLLSEVHYSWLLPTLKTYTKKDIGYFLLSLEKEQQEKIKKQIPKIALPRKKLSEVSIHFFHHLLTSSLLPEDFLLLPENALNTSPYHELLHLNKNRLILFIDLISLFDLKAEMKTLVDKKTLQQLQEVLTEEQKAFLSSIKSYKEPLTTPKMGLEHWDGDTKIFQALLHKRGINRLAKGIANESPSFLWHISHRLDIGRGGLLLKLTEEKTQEEIQKIIEKNIVFTLEYLNQPKEGKQ